MSMAELAAGVHLLNLSEPRSQFTRSFLSGETGHWRRLSGMTEMGPLAARPLSGANMGEADMHPCWTHWRFRPEADLRSLRSKDLL